MWDPHWDPRLRKLIHAKLLKRSADSSHKLEHITLHLDTTIEFERDACTTLEDAKRLTADSACLRSFASTDRTAFLDAVEGADTTGSFKFVLREFQMIAQMSYTSCCFMQLIHCPCRFEKEEVAENLVFIDCFLVYAGDVVPGSTTTERLADGPPIESHVLYLILNDDEICAADPLGALREQLSNAHHYRLSNAKLLTRDSKCFNGVPSRAIDRFIQLVELYAVSEGARSHLFVKKCAVR
jgi:hypothetical protein